MKILNSSLNHHTIIGAIIGLWSFIFAFFSKPFEHGTMDFQKWVYVSVGYSLLAFITYILINFYQKYCYKKLGSWNIPFEISVYILFFSLFTLLTFGYYKSSIIDGTYSFSKYFTQIIFNIILIVTPLLFLARLYVQKLIPVTEDDIIIRGENKLDILKIKQAELICISNAQNYVEIFFLDNAQLKSKLIRSSLKKLQTDFQFLVQVHRSHLINPAHFKSWKDSATISLTQIELPVSKNYKSQLLEL